MKRFAFRFNRVLETKRHIEEAKKNALAALVAQRLQDETQLLAIQGELLDRQRELAGRAEAGKTLSDVALMVRYFSKLADDIRRLEKVLARWDAEIEAKRAEFVEAKRETATLEKLEATDRRAYMKAVAGWEQKLIDDVATGRYVRGLHEEVYG